MRIAFQWLLAMYFATGAALAGETVQAPDRASGLYLVRQGAVWSVGRTGVVGKRGADTTWILGVH